MKIHAIITSGLALTTLTCGALWLHSRGLQRLESTDQPYRRSLLEAMDRQQKQEARLQALDAELTRLQTELTETEQSRRAAEDRIETLEDEIRNPRVLPDYFAKRLAGVPGKDGKYTRLISPSGHVHAKDAIYSSSNGSQLTFKIEGRPQAFMASQIHPVILTDLGLSLEQLRADQKKLNAERSAQRIWAQAESQARILTFASMMQRERTAPVPVATAEATTSTRQPSPELLNELIARQRAFDQQQRARKLAEAAANSTVRVMGPPQSYGGGQQRPPCRRSR